MCDNPLSPELKSALLVDLQRPLTRADQLIVDRLVAGLRLTNITNAGRAAEARPAPLSSAITAVVSEASAEEISNGRITA